MRRVIDTCRVERRLDAYLDLISMIFGRLDDFRDELAIVNDYLAEAKRQKNISKEGNARINKLYLLSDNNLYDSLVAQLPDNLDFFKRHEMWDNYFNGWSVTMRMYVQKNQYEMALAEAKAMYKAAQEIGNDSGLGVTARCVGEVYQTMGRHDQAEVYMREAVEYSRKSGHMLALINSYFILCQTLMAQNKYPEALAIADEYAEAIDSYHAFLQTRYDDPDSFSSQSRFYCYLVYATGYLETGDLAKGEEYLKKAEKLSAAYSEYFRLGSVIVRARFEELKGEYDKALENFNEGYRIQLEMGDRMDAMQTREIIARVHFTKGDYREAGAIYKELLVQKDSLRNMKFGAQLDELRIIYEVDKIMAEKERTVIYLTAAFIVCLLLILILGGWIFYSRALASKNRGLVRQIQEQDRLRKELKVIESRTHDPASEPAETNDPGQKLFRRLEEYLAATGCFKNGDLDRKELVSALSTNEKYLYNAVKGATGLTLLEYINKLRLEEAKQMLETQPSLTIDAILYECGFNAPRTFYRLFREHYDMSPKEYRNGLSRA